MAGKIALVDRGTCGFAVKVKNAQNAGAIGVDRRQQRRRRRRRRWPASTRRSRSRRCVITLANGNADQGRARRGSRQRDAEGQGGATAPRTPTAGSMGEDSTAFGGAIRDMWNPTCISDPGKVTDAEYTATRPTAAACTRTRASPTTATPCSWTAARTTARPSPGIGLTKAAHIYWRAQTRLPDADDRVRRPRGRARGSPAPT